MNERKEREREVGIKNSVLPFQSGVREENGSEGLSYPQRQGAEQKKEQKKMVYACCCCTRPTYTGKRTQFQTVIDTQGRQKTREWVRQAAILVVKLSRSACSMNMNTHTHTYTHREAGKSRVWPGTGKSKSMSHPTGGAGEGAYLSLTLSVMHHEK